MRFEKLEIENINSFIGKHSIDFNSLLKSSDIFAITGPTGSGKSTILSCFSLALFGQHYKSSLSSFDFVSIGQPSGSIKLSFTIGKNTYDALWECRVLKKDGTKRKNIAPKKQLLCNGKPTEEKIESIIHLDFNQFCRVVILNQGEFSKLLTSTFSERRKILEKLSGIDNLEKLSSFWRQGEKSLKENVQNLKLQIQSTQTISGQELKEIKKQLTVLNDLLPLKKSTINYLDFFYNICKRIEQYNLLKKTNQEQFKKTQESISEIQEVINKEKVKLEQLSLDLKNKKITLSELEPKLNTGIKHITRLESLDSQIHKTKESNKKLKQDLSEKKERKAHLEKENKLLNKKIETIPSFIKNWNDQLLQKAESLIPEGQKKEQQILSCHQYIQQYNDELKKYQEKAEEYKKEENTIEQTITKLLGALSLESLDQIKEFEKSLSEKEKHYHQNSHHLTSLKKKVKNIQVDLKQLQNKLKKAHSEHKEVHSKFLDAQKRYLDTEKLLLTQQENILLKQLLEESLTDSKCKLCDSSENLKRIEEKISHFLNSKEDDLIEIEPLKEKYNNLLRKESTSIEQSKNLEEAIKEKDRELHSLNKEILQTEISCKDDIIKEVNSSKENISKLKEAASKKEFVSNQLVELRQDYKKSLHYKKEYESEQKAHFLKQDELIISLTNLLKIERKDHWIEQEEVYKKARSFYQELKETDHLKENMAIALSHNKSSIQSIEEQIKEHLTIIESLDKEAAKHKEDLKKLQLPEKPEEHLEKLKSNVEQAFKEVDDQKSVIQKQELNKQTFEANLFHLEESQKLLYSQLKEIKREIKQFEHNNHDLPFIDIYNKLKGWAETDKEEFSSIINESLMEEVHYRLEQERKELKAKETEVTRIQEVINIEQRQQEKAHSINASLIRNQEKLELYQSLTPYLKNDDFRNYILQVIEDELLWFANLQLKELADGRYKLRAPSFEGKNSEFLIEDYWFTQGIRKVSTLSGGETFMLSLGLALGMSEMTRGQAYVDCFFIDEGFGTLDQNSLEEVLDCLSVVRSTGKQIGIISHIKELTERIPCQIKLTKSENDYSQIQLVT